MLRAYHAGMLVPGAPTTSRFAEEVRIAVNDRLAELLGAEGPFRDTYAYVLSLPGKRLRAGLTIAAGRLDPGHAAPGVPDADVLDLACAVEMLHEASLLHDDICDGSLTRRGGKSVAARSGVHLAALAGLHLAGAALRLFADVLGRNPVVAAQVRAPWGINELHRVGELALGQIIESVPPPATDLAGLRRNYRLVAVAKTGTLFRLACSHGGAAAGCDRDGQQALARYADHLAVAFQIMDDIRDVESPTGTDIDGHITTWPVIEWLGSRAIAADLWHAAGTGHATRATLDRIHADVVDSGAVERARAGAAREAEAASAALDAFPDADGRRHLAELCSAVLVR